MIQIIGMLLTTTSAAALGLIIEGLSHTQQWMLSRFSPLPHSERSEECGGGEEDADAETEEDICN